MIIDGSLSPIFALKSRLGKLKRNYWNSNW